MSGQSFAVSYARSGRRLALRRVAVVFLLGFVAGGVFFSWLIRARYETELCAIEMADPIPAEPTKPPSQAWNRVSTPIQSALHPVANGLQIDFEPEPAAMTRPKAPWASWSVLAEADSPLLTPGQQQIANFVAMAGLVITVLAYLRKHRSGLAEEISMVIDAKKAAEEKNRFPNPVEVVAAVHFATKEDVGEVKEEVEKSRSERKTSFSELSTRMSVMEALERERTEKLHGRIDGLTAKVGAIEGKTEVAVEGIQAIQEILMKGRT